MTCARLRREQDEVLRQARAEPDEDGRTVSDELLSSLPKELGVCQRAGKGAWVFRFTSLSPAWDDAAAFSASPSVVHVGLDGAVQSLSTAGLGDHGGCRVVSLDMSTYDFDGDGHGELAYCLSTNEYVLRVPDMQIPGDKEYCALLTSQPAVHSYLDDVGSAGNAADLALEDVRDVDGDGRPDLLIRSPLADLLGSEQGFSRSARSPLFVMHALPSGGFTFHDDVARAAAREICPSRPRHAFVTGGDADEYEKAIHALACMLVWQAPKSEIEAELKRAAQLFGPGYDENLGWVRAAVMERTPDVPRLP